MARLTAIDPDTASGDALSVFDHLQHSIGRVPAMVRLMAHSPAIADIYVHFNHALERTTLSAHTRALITVAVAELNGCDYTLSLGIALGKRQGVGADDLELARSGQASDPKTAKVLEFATDIVRLGGHVPEAEVQRLLTDGFSETEIVDVVAAVGLNVFRNYFNLVVGTDIDVPVIRTHRSMQAA